MSFPCKSAKDLFKDTSTHMQGPPDVGIKRRSDALGRVLIIKIHSSVIDEHIHSSMIFFDHLCEAPDA